MHSCQRRAERRLDHDSPGATILEGGPELRELVRRPSHSKITPAQPLFEQGLAWLSTIEQTGAGRRLNGSPVIYESTFIDEFRYLVMPTEDNLMPGESRPEPSDGWYGEQQIAESSWMHDDDCATHRFQSEEPFLTFAWITRAASRSDGVFTL